MGDTHLTGSGFDSRLPCEWCKKAVDSTYVTGDDGAKYCSRECRTAHWCLLGAAPELLAACERAHEFLLDHVCRGDDNHSDFEERESLRCILEAAIAEAKGE